MALPGNGRDGEAPVDFDDDDVTDAEEQLTLADAEERLPWLESDDDYEQPGIDSGRIVAFAAVGLLFVVLLLGGLWLLTREPADEVAIADGSTIEAPNTPYKTRPKDPGGRQVEGTGDTSFAVAEGEVVEGQIDTGEVPVPSIDREQAGSPTPTASALVAASAPAGSIGVQVGAYSTRAQAETGWGELVARFDTLHGRSHRVLQATADSGTVFRLQALAGTAAEADALCRGIKDQGGDCQVKR